MSVSLYLPAPLTSNEARRNAAVRSSGLLERVHNERLTQICHDARTHVGGGWAGIALILGDAQLVIASTGENIGRHSRAASMSAYAILEPDAVFCVPDTQADDRFLSNPFVRVGLIRYFVAAVICDHVGYALGTLCVSRRSPGNYVEADVALGLRRMAQLVAAKEQDTARSGSLMRFVASASLADLSN